jgi:hypothetical protein
VPVSDFIFGMDISNFPYKILELESKIETRLSGTCTDEASNRRIKCSAELEWDSYFSNQCGTGTIYEVAIEAENKYQRYRFGFWWNVRANKIWIDYSFQVRKDNWLGQVVFSHDYTVEEIDSKKAEISDFERFCVDTRTPDNYYCISEAVFDNYAEGFLDYNCEISLDNGGCQFLL